MSLGLSVGLYRYSGDPSSFSRYFEASYLIEAEVLVNVVGHLFNDFCVLHVLIQAR